MKEEWKEYLKRYMAENSSWNLEKGLLLLAMKSMAEAEADEGCVPPLLNAAKEWMAEARERKKWPEENCSLLSGVVGRLLDAAFRAAGEEIYRNALTDLAEEMDVWAVQDAMSFYGIMPFLMTYETDYHNKEGYNRLHSRFREAEDVGFARHSGEEEGWYLMALIDTYEVISEQIFEQKKYLQQVLKKRLKAALESETYRKEGIGSLMLSYTILKACRLEAILEEKYRDTGEALLENNQRGDALTEEAGCSDPLFMSLLLMAWSERIRLEA